MLLLPDRNFKLSSSRPELVFPREDPRGAWTAIHASFFTPDARHNRLSVLATFGMSPARFICPKAMPDNSVTQGKKFLSDNI